MLLGPEIMVGWAHQSELIQMFNQRDNHLDLSHDSMTAKSPQHWFSSMWNPYQLPRGVWTSISCDVPAQSRGTRGYTVITDL